MLDAALISSVNTMPRKLSCKLDAGNSNVITDVKLMTYASDWTGNVTVGQVVSSYISVTVPTPNFSLAGVNVALSMGIGAPVTWTKIGDFRVDEESIRTKQGYTAFYAYDKLYSAKNTYHSTGNKTLQAICDEICSAIGITSATLPVSITIDSEILDGYTMRDVLGFIAAYNGKNAYISPSGALDLRWFSSSSYTADGTRANIPYIGENNCTIGRLICQAQDGVLTSGSGQGIYFTCPFMTQDRLNAMLSGLSMTYRKADVDIPFGTYLLQSGDIITVSTTGSNLSVPIMSNSWTYDGGVSSAVTSYGVSDYSGTANNAESSLSAMRVQRVLDSKRADNRATSIVQTEVQHATELITGATGGYIKLEFGGNGKTAQLLVMDQPSIDNALNVWIFNQNGLGHMQRETTSDPFSQVNVALTREGTVVAERIAGQKISGVQVETTASGTGSRPQVVVEDGTYTINRISSNDTVVLVGTIKYIPRGAQDEIDTIAIHVQEGGAVTIGYEYGAGQMNDEFIYYSDLSAAPPGASKYNFFDGDIAFFNTYDNRMVTLQAKLADLEQRIEALENAINDGQ